MDVDALNYCFSYFKLTRSSLTGNILILLNAFLDVLWTYQTNQMHWYEPFASTPSIANPVYRLYGCFGDDFLMLVY
jgi:hypothetical protein